MKNVTYMVALSHSGIVDVPDDATDQDIRQAIEDDIPKYVSIRTWSGIGQDAEYEYEHTKEK